MKRLLFTSLALTALAANSASAHIDVVGPVESRNGDQKAGPCEGVPRGNNKVYTFEPGATVTISINEGIAHPGYFRIAFDNDGEDAFKEPQSIKPIDPSRACPFESSFPPSLKENDRCTASDFCNVTSTSGGASVLWDNIDPHASGGGMRSFTFKLPDVECENCTIQILQIMEDTVHGGYCPKGVCTNEPFYIEDIYHRCIDVTLKRGAGMTPGTVTTAPNVNGLDCVAMANGQDAGTPVVNNDGGAPVTADSGASHEGGHDAGVTTPTTDSGAPAVAYDGGYVPAADAGAPSAPAEDDGGCSVRQPGEASGSDIALALASLFGGALVLRRRRRRD